jgi:lysocardiolipin and lysophospholipid acyltransferase
MINESDGQNNRQNDAQQHKPQNKHDYLRDCSRRLRGCCVIAYFAVSCFALLTLFALPALPIFVAMRFIVGKRLARRVLRKYADTLQALYIVQIPAIIEAVFSTRIVVSGAASINQIARSKSLLVVANHRTRLDWLFLWHFVTRFLDPSLQKIVLKRQLERVPLLGLAVHLLNFLYLERNWTNDEARIERAINYWSASEHETQLLLFPEGTDFTPSNVAKSNARCDENNEARFRHVLAPRTAGFAHCLLNGEDNGLFARVLDITIGYKAPPTIGMPQTEKALLFGRLPAEIHFHARFYDAGDPDEASSLLDKIWRNKDALLERFERNGQFSDNATVQPAILAEILVFFSWLILSVGLLYEASVYNGLFWWTVLCAAYIFVIFPLWPIDIATLEQKLF